MRISQPSQSGIRICRVGQETHCSILLFEAASCAFNYDRFLTMSDRFYTFMVVPEKSDRIRKISIPAWAVKIASLLGLAIIFLGTFVFFDYLHVLSQVAENKRLRVENHLLKLDIQEATSTLDNLDQTVNRLKSFAEKLKIISNLDSSNAQKLLQAPMMPDSRRDGRNDTNSTTPEEGEDSGNLTTPDETSQLPPNPEDKHANLEYQRSLTIRGENATELDSDNLVVQLEQIQDRATSLIEIANRDEETLAELQEYLQDRKDRLQRTPSILPAQGWISSEFGWRSNPFSGQKTFHAGLDVANNYDTPVYAPADGVVTMAGTLGGFGQIVRLDHGYNLVSKFGHNSRILVKQGQPVKRGDLIARMGSSGRSTGPHLHYQVEVSGKPVNPRLFILNDNF